MFVRKQRFALPPSSGFVLLLALVLAATARLGWPDLIEFKNDEAWTLSVASSIARDHAHPLVGIGSSLGVPNAAFFVYLMAIPEIVTRDPAVGTPSEDPM